MVMLLGVLAATSHVQVFLMIVFVKINCETRIVNAARSAAKFSYNFFVCQSACHNTHTPLEIVAPHNIMITLPQWSIVHLLVVVFLLAKIKFQQKSERCRDGKDKQIKQTRLELYGSYMRLNSTSLPVPVSYHIEKNYMVSTVSTYSITSPNELHHYNYIVPCVHLTLEQFNSKF